MQLKAALQLKTKRWLNAIQHGIISAEGDAQRLRHERRLWMSLADEDWLQRAPAGDDDAAAAAREIKEGDKKLCCECCGAPVGIDGVSCSMGELDALQGGAGGGSAARECDGDADSEEGCVEGTAAKGKAMMQRIIDLAHQHARPLHPCSLLFRRASRRQISLPRPSARSCTFCPRLGAARHVGAHQIRHLEP